MQWTFPDGSYVSKEYHTLVRIVVVDADRCMLEFRNNTNNHEVYHTFNGTPDEARHFLNGETKPELIWSKKFEWHGHGFCPLPEGTKVRYTMRSGVVDTSYAHLLLWRHREGRSDIISFEYQCLHYGWIERPDNFIPNDMFWDDDCPVGMEWCTSKAPPIHGAEYSPNLTHAGWNRSPRVTYMRLVHRDVKPSLPDGFYIGRTGNLFYRDDRSRCVILKDNAKLLPDTTPEAVASYMKWVKRND